MTMHSAPATVEPGQMWRDNEQRTKGSGEFVVTEVFHDVRYAGYRKQRSGYFARVDRGDGRKTVIAVTRLLKGGSTQRGYTYLGMSK